MVTKESTRNLVLSNALTAVAALIMHWPLATLLWPYWIQSIIIGWYSRKRMLALTNFTTEGLTSNDQPVEATPASLRSTARFFVLHYGFFHFVYLIFLCQGAAKITPLDWLTFAGLAVSFAMSHGSSFRQNIAADRRGCPNLGVLLFLPYLRVIPMHLAILFGGAVAGDSAGALLLFVALKTVADVAMHRAEHRLLQRGASDEATAEER